MKVLLKNDALHIKTAGRMRVGFIHSFFIHLFFVSFVLYFWPIFGPYLIYVSSLFSAHLFNADFIILYTNFIISDINSIISAHM